LAVAQQEIVKADFAAAARAIAKGFAVVSSGSDLQQASHGEEHETYGMLRHLQRF